MHRYRTVSRLNAAYAVKTRGFPAGHIYSLFISTSLYFQFKVYFNSRGSSSHHRVCSPWYKGGSSSWSRPNDDYTMEASRSLLRIPKFLPIMSLVLVVVSIFSVICKLVTCHPKIPGGV